MIDAKVIIEVEIHTTLFTDNVDIEIRITDGVEH